jgi:endonuclease/exonuclease/phosphatase family metal-dependent hydrolase
VKTLRLLSYNIRYGGIGREDALASTITACEPDLVLLQEATDAGTVQRVAERSHMGQWATFKRQSLGFLSRAPVEHFEWHQPRFSRHAFLDIVPAGTSVRFFGVHLSAVHAAWTERRRLFEIRALLRSVERHKSGFHVLAGDFNTLAPGALLDVKRLPARLRPFLWLSGGTVRWRTIQQILDAGYVDAFRHLHPRDPGYTFPTSDPHVRLDYVFVPRGFADRVTSCRVTNGQRAVGASDHFPLLAELMV